MEENYNEVKRNWWDRNWKWFVPTGCLSIIVLFGLFIAGIFFGVTSLMKDSDVYKDAIHQVKQNKAVVQQLGSPVEAEGMPSGSINVSNNTGECDLEIPIKGPKGTGILFVTAHKKVKWTYDELSVYITATEKEINLLEK